MARPRRRSNAGFTLTVAAASIAGACVAMVAVPVFLCLALFYWMEPIAGAALAALLVAVLALVLTVILALVVVLLPKPSLMGMILPSEEEVFGRLTAAIELGRELGLEGKRLVSSNLGGATLGALGFGVLLGISPRLRRAVFMLLRGK